MKLHTTVRALAAVLLAATALLALPARADANLQINTPDILNLRAQLRDNFHALRPLVVAGAVGLTSNGELAIRDLNSVPLAQRAQVIAEVEQQNRNLLALYAGIAQANGHPEWTGDIRMTFARKWLQKEPAGWYYRDASGVWHQK